MIQKIHRHINHFGTDEWRSVVVSYRMVDRPIVTTRTGWGKTYKAALVDADSQLSDGTWKRTCVCNPGSIHEDLRQEHTRKRRIGIRGEGVVIRVERRISEVIDAP